MPLKIQPIRIQAMVLNPTFPSHATYISYGMCRPLYNFSMALHKICMQYNLSLTLSHYTPELLPSAGCLQNSLAKKDVIAGWISVVITQLRRQLK